ncbi:hypothetical protein [Streptomyces sp. NPDC005732]|uniref:hypothetical protein n=1 Tax=Streptomyces sp. NPDC005732 TaxID=3157057 RepID=UPI0033C9153C
MNAPAAERATAEEITALRMRVADLHRQIADAKEWRHALRITAGFKDSEAAGYVDRTGLEA